MFRIAVAQIAPVVLDRRATLGKVVASIHAAADAGARLVVFGEAIVGGYPVWLERSGGARFDDPAQKSIHARYLEEAVVIERGDLDSVREAARERGVHVILGIIERAVDRGGYTLFCAAAGIDDAGEIALRHRKLMPTHEERLAWGLGDGAGLVTREIGPFRVGALLCWENWMPLARTALYEQGLDLHCMLWPGSERNTRDLTPVVAREARAFVVSASGFIRGRDVAADAPHRDAWAGGDDEILRDGGSGIAGPDGTWIVEPVTGREDLLLADLDPAVVRAERLTFDPAGHYARPDVLRLRVRRRRLAP